MLLLVGIGCSSNTNNADDYGGVPDDYALEELRRHAGTQFDPDVVEAFITALTVSGERYGLPDMNDDREARRMAERAAGALRFPDSQRSAGDPGPSDTQETIRG